MDTFWAKNVALFLIIFLVLLAFLTEKQSKKICNIKFIYNLFKIYRIFNLL